VPLRVRKFIFELIGFVKGDFYLLPKSQITYSHDLLYTYHNADFLRESLFAKAYALGKKTDKDLLLKDYDIEWRVHVLCWAASNAIKLQGDFVDCGVHTGIYARAVIHYTNFKKTKKKYYLLDTFNGLDEKYSTTEELKRNNKMGYNKRGDIYAEVCETFKDFNVRVIKGAVPTTLPLVKSKKIAYLSIDMNCVKPEFDALNFFWDKMVKGGVIILDDYGYANSTNDQKKAHDAFALSKGIKILTLPTCQGLIIKT
jgi:hypothetical protein